MPRLGNEFQHNCHESWSVYLQVLHTSAGYSARTHTDSNSAGRSGGRLLAPVSTLTRGPGSGNEAVRSNLLVGEATQGRR
jgi:hypothetical protein